MGLRRTWARVLSGALGAAVVVPLGLLLAVALAATLGGGGLGGLDQLVRGPSLPGAGPVASALQTGGRGATGGVPAIPTGVGDEARSTGGLGSGAGDGSDASSESRDPGGSSSPGGSDKGTTRTDDGPEPTTETTPAAAIPTPAPGAIASPTQTPEPPQDPATEIARGVGTVADQAVRPLPVVGEPAADAVGTVIDLVAPPRTAEPVPEVVAGSAVPAP